MSTPGLSVVIACVNGLPIIDECLRAIQAQQGSVRVQTVVVDCCNNGTAEHIKRGFPGVKLVKVTERLGIPELRAIGTSHATEDVVAIIEDHCIVPDNWAEATLRAHQPGYAAVGGAVENGSVDRIVDWAAFLCEYSHAMLPIPEGEAIAITGNNASYKRELLNRVDESVKKSCWEFFLHEELEKLGARFLSAPAVLVYHKKEFGYWYFMSQRFHYSRSFAAMRRSRVSQVRRLFYVLSAPLLPGLMTWRIAKQVHHKRRYYKEFFMSLPILATFMVSYAAGEFTGYLAGPGRSLYRVE